MAREASPRSQPEEDYGFPVLGQAQLMSDLVEVEVIETNRTGVRVKILEDGRAGFIRRQELSWDQRLDSVPPVPEVGERLQARVLGSRDSRYVRLSLRLGDPWQDQRVEERFEAGQVV